MKPRMRFLLGSLAAGMFLLLTAPQIWAQTYSHTRVLRLSYAEGSVTIERPDMSTWSEAPVNTPIQEGFKLSTGDNSFAEVELENGGTIRLGQLSLLDFTQLSLTSDGGKIDRMDLRQGYATFHQLGASGTDTFEVTTPYSDLTSRGTAIFRVDLDQGAERIEVLKGVVDAQSNQGSWALADDTVLVFEPGSNEPPEVSQGITRDDWDKWVEDREERMETSPSGPAPETYANNAPDSTYGWNELSYSGSWSNVPGYGYGWTPNSVGISWAPFTAGQWCWYPGWGYTWISSEPWGWLPYHYGGWEFVPGIGWVWFPGYFGTWSPAQVTWYNGPGWVGWIPRPPHRKASGAACASGNCGGGALSAAAFRNGARVNSASLMDLNPATGKITAELGIRPVTASMLPGRPVAQPASSVSVRDATVGAGESTTTTSIAFSPPSGHTAALASVTGAAPRRGGGMATPDAAIVYDPETHRYVNGSRATPTQEALASRTETVVPPAAAAMPNAFEPVPVENRGEGELPTNDPFFLQRTGNTPGNCATWPCPYSFGYSSGGRSTTSANCAASSLTPCPSSFGYSPSGPGTALPKRPPTRKGEPETPAPTSVQAGGPSRTGIGQGHPGGAPGAGFGGGHPGGGSAAGGHR